MDLIRANGMILKGSEFSSCSLKEADFTEADLTSVTFEECNLERAIFIKTNLKNTNFSSAYYYTLDPSKNLLKKTIFSSSGIKGLLSPFDIIIKN